MTPQQTVNYLFDGLDLRKLSKSSSSLRWNQKLEYYSHFPALRVDIYLALVNEAILAAHISFAGSSSNTGIGGNQGDPAAAYAAYNAFSQDFFDNEKGPLMRRAQRSQLDLEAFLIKDGWWESRAGRRVYSIGYQQYYKLYHSGGGSQ